MREFEKLRGAIDDSIRKVRELPAFSGPSFSTEALKDEVIPILEEAKEAIWESKERFARLEKLRGEIDTVRDEIISPVNERIEASKRTNYMFGFAGLLIGALSVCLSIALALRPSGTNTSFDELFVNLLRTADSEEFIAGTLNTPQDPPKFDDLLFEPNARRPLLHSEIELNRLLNIMYFYPDLRVRLVGYADSVGSDKNNRRRSERRVNFVRDFLVSSGIGDERVEVDFYGEASPKAPNSSELGREVNRRVEIHATLPHSNLRETTVAKGNKRDGGISVSD